MVTITATFEIDESKYQNELIQQYFVRMLKEKAWEVAIGQDHTTVLHAERTIKKELNHKFDNEYKIHIEELINKIKYES